MKYKKVKEVIGIKYAVAHELPKQIREIFDW